MRPGDWVTVTGGSRPMVVVRMMGLSVACSWRVGHSVRYDSFALCSLRPCAPALAAAMEGSARL